MNSLSDVLASAGVLFQYVINAIETLISYFFYIEILGINLGDFLMFFGILGFILWFIIGGVDDD